MSLFSVQKVARQKINSQQCAHCGNEHFEGTKFSLIIDGKACVMCCPACCSVAQMIQDIYLNSGVNMLHRPSSK